MVVTASKKTMAFTATRPTPFNSSWPAMPVTMPPKISGATIMRIRRRKMSPRNFICPAACGASAPSTAPASIAKNVHTSSDRLRNATGTNDRIPAHRRTIRDGRRGIGPHQNPDGKQHNRRPTGCAPTSRSTRSAVKRWNGRVQEIHYPTLGFQFAGRRTPIPPLRREHPLE